MSISFKLIRAEELKAGMKVIDGNTMQVWEVASVKPDNLYGADLIVHWTNGKFDVLCNGERAAIPV